MNSPANHADVKKHLPDYLEGELALEDRAVVDAHLDECPSCAQEVSEMEQTVLLLRSMPEPETPPMIAANVMRRIRAGETRPGPIARILHGLGSIFEPSFVLPASAMAAAALVVVVLQDPASIGLGTRGEPAVAGLEPAAAGSTRGQDTKVAREATVDVMLVSPLADAATRGRRARNGALGMEERETPTPMLRSFSGVLAAAPPPAFVASAAPVAEGRRAQIMSRPSQLAPRAIGRNAAFRGAVPVAGPVAPGVLDGLRARRAAGTLTSRDGQSSGGGDPRDAWLGLALKRPADFAQFLAGKSLAEQELWVARLADRASSRGLDEELVRTLAASGDEAARILSEDLRAEADRLAADRAEAN